MNKLKLFFVLLMLAVVQTASASILLVDEDTEDYGYWIRDIGVFPINNISVTSLIDLPFSTYGSITLQNQASTRMISLQINKNAEGIGAYRFGVYLVNSTGAGYAYSGNFTNTNEIDPTWHQVQYKLKYHRYLTVAINGVTVLDSFDTGINAKTELTQLKYASGWSGIGDMVVMQERTNLLLRPDGYRPFL